MKLVVENHRALTPFPYLRTLLIKAIYFISQMIIGLLLTLIISYFMPTMCLPRMIDNESMLLLYGFFYLKRRVKFTRMNGHVCSSKELFIVMNVDSCAELCKNFNRAFYDSSVTILICNKKRVLVTMWKGSSSRKTKRDEKRS